MTAQPNIFHKFAAQNDAQKFNTFLPSIEEKETIEAPSTGNIFERQAAKNKKVEEEKFSFLDYARDVGEQIITKGISGFAGNYGNLREMVGLQPQKTSDQITPIQSQELATLEKLQQGQRPSLEEIASLSDEDIIPRATRLPTSQNIQETIKEKTGIGEAKTPAGRIAGRGAEFFGEAASIPIGIAPKVLAGAAISGVAGQSAREAGLPEPVASGIEIATSLAPSVISKKLIPGSKEAKKLTEAGRALGLSENQITPLIQSERKIATAAPFARKGSKTKELFSTIKQKLGDSYDTIKSNPLAQKNITPKQKNILLNDFNQIRDDLAKTLAASPEREGALKFVDTALAKLRNSNVTSEELVNFWQEINKSVKWNSLQGGKKALARLKKPVLDVLENVSPALAKDFEMTNELYSKYAQISKKLKPDIIDSLLSKGELFTIIPSAGALMFGNPWPLVSVGGGEAIRILAREMLINPYFQNLGTKLVKNANSGSVKAIQELVRQSRDFMTRKHPDQNWDFLLDSTPRTE